MLEVFIAMSVVGSTISAVGALMNWRAIVSLEKDSNARLDRFAAALLKAENQHTAAAAVKPKAPVSTKKETLPMQRPQTIGLSPRTHG